MSRIARVIDANPLGFNANGPGVGPGDLVMDFSSPVRRVGLIVRASPTVQELVELRADVAGLGSVIWTPGAGGSGDATLSGSITSNVDGAPTTAGTIEITLNSSAAINSVSVGAGGVNLLSLISGTQALVRIELPVTGLFSLAIDGTAGASLRWTVGILDPPSGNYTSNPEVLP